MPRPSPSSQLAGKSLDGGWIVGQLIERQPQATGGHFSHGYEVTSGDGVRAYLKALDFAAAMGSPDPARALQALTETYNHERRLCEECRTRRLSRVVKAITDGKVLVDPADPFTVVQYLIFELAVGDVRAHLDAVVLDAGRADLGQGRAAAEHLVGEEPDRRGSPARLVAVGHAHGDAQRAGALGRAVALLEAVERVGEVVGAGHPKDWHSRLGQVAGRLKVQNSRHGPAA